MTTLPRSSQIRYGTDTIRMDIPPYRTFVSIRFEKLHTSSAFRRTPSILISSLLEGGTTDTSSYRRSLCYTLIHINMSL